MNGHLSLVIATRIAVGNEVVEAGPKVGGLLPFQNGDLAEGQDALPQGVGGQPDGPLDAVLGNGGVEEGLCAGRVEDVLPLVVAEAGLTVAGDAEDEVVEVLLPLGGGLPSGGFVV